MEAMSEERPAKRLKTSVEIEGEDATAAPPAQNSAAEDATTAVLRKEQQVGMAIFVAAGQPRITGVVKQRYTDFLVNEVMPDGKVLHLRKTTYDGAGASAKAQQNSSASQEEKSKEPNGQEVKNAPVEKSNETESAEQSPVSEEDRTKLVGYLGETATSEILELFASIKENPKKRSREHPIVNTPFTSDRMVRTEIHQAIRRIFHSRIDSSTNKDGVLVLSAANPNFRNNHTSRVGKLSWIERGGEHCHFTLYKEMKDTMESVSFLAYLMKKNPRDFQIAGTKDRRAATVQRISVWRVEAERLAALNRNPTMKNAVLGDFEYHPSGLQLGDLSGNEFTVTVRDVQSLDGDSTDAAILQANLESSLSSLHINGFLNYYGLQRFGTFAIRSDILGLQILKGDFEGACNSILDYNPAALDESNLDIARDDRARAEAIKIFRETNAIRDALAVMPKRLSAESAVIRALGRNPTDHLGALMTMQRNMRQMYVHAYQSLIWNKAATNRWEVYGNKVVEGDLVLVSEHKDKEVNLPSAPATATQPEAVEPTDEVIIHPEGSDCARATNASKDAFERARPLTTAEAASGQYSIFDIVLPLPGFDVLYPSNASGGEFYKRIMGEDGLDPYDMRRGQKDFSLSGSYRKMVGRIAEGWSAEVKEYVQEDEQFVVTDREALVGGGGGGGGGGGRKEAAQKGKNGELSEQGEGAANDAEAANADDDSEQQKEQKPKVAAILRFQLGTSQYATMALRELSRGGLMEYKPGFSGGR